MADGLDMGKIALTLAHRLRAIAVKQTVPVGEGSKSWRKTTKRGRTVSGGVDKQGGELRKSVHVTPFSGGAIVGTNKAYARAVHEGRGGMIIRPRRKKALAWNKGNSLARKVFQPARKGKPFFRQAIDIFEGNIDGELRSLGIAEGAASELKRALENKGIKVRKI